MLNQIFLPQLFKDALTSVVNSLAKDCAKFYEVRLFGSCVKGNFSSKSDLDFLIITRNTTLTREERSQFREVIADALEIYNLKSDVVFYTLFDYEHDSSNFTQSIHDNFLLLRGDD